MIFIDRVDITKQDGSAPIGLEPAGLPRHPDQAARDQHARQMLIFGLTADAKDAPGPFGVYTHANSHRMTRSTTGGDGKPAMTEENWVFSAASGEHLEVSLTYERAAARKSANETKFFSATNPGFQQIFKIEQGLDIMRNATVPVRDRVTKFSYKGSGGKIAPLFDGTERVVSIDALHWYNRGVYAPRASFGSVGQRRRGGRNTRRRTRPCEYTSVPRAARRHRHAGGRPGPPM